MCRFEYISIKIPINIFLEISSNDDNSYDSYDSDDYFNGL